MKSPFAAEFRTIIPLHYTTCTAHDVAQTSCLGTLDKGAIFVTTTLQAGHLTVHLSLHLAGEHALSEVYELRIARDSWSFMRRVAGAWSCS